jgi:hypothetical protein
MLNALFLAPRPLWRQRIDVSGREVTVPGEMATPRAGCQVYYRKLGFPTAISFSSEACLPLSGLDPIGGARREFPAFPSFRTRNVRALRARLIPLAGACRPRIGQAGGEDSVEDVGGRGHRARIWAAGPIRSRVH